MKQATLYFNPSCSKSRAALQLLENHDYQVEVIEYLHHMPTAKQLGKWIEQMQIEAIALVRTNEPLWQDLHVDKNELTSDEIIRILIQHPQLLQRPIACLDGQIIIARPAEKLLEFI